MRIRSINAMILVATTLLACRSSAADDKRPKVVLETTLGAIEITLFADKAPVSVRNFLEYVDAGFYDGLVFHRVIPGFMVQGGGYGADLAPKKPRATIVNEAANGLKNLKGTLALARTSDPNSATSQFFINTADNKALDHRGTAPADMGYCVFGEVTSGMEVVIKIENTPTKCPSKSGGPCMDGLPPGMRDVPATPVVITKASRKK